MVRIRESTVIDAPIEDVWRILRDFNSHESWHPTIAESHIEDGMAGHVVGAIRNFRLADGGRLREQLLSLDDAAHELTYCILEAPLPLHGYVATIRLKPVTDGQRTFWSWESQFAPPPHRAVELADLVANGIYRAGFEALRQLFAASSRRAARSGEPSAQSTRPQASPTLTPAIAARTLSRPAAVDPSGDIGAIVVDRHGGPEVLAFRRTKLPPPGPGEVRIRHTAIGVNFIDVYCRTGYFDLLPIPGTPGMEAAGVIEATGPGIFGWRPGERVAYACPPVGAYSQARNMSPELLVRLPDDISDEAAAAGLLKGVTASFLTHEVATVRPDDIVLIHAAAGGVGQMLVQWARHLGATVIATASTDAKAQIASRLGADRVIVYSREDFAASVMHATGGHGADIVFDAVGADTFDDSLAALAVCGHLVSFGQASGPIGMREIGGLASKSVTLSRPNYGHYTDTPQKLGRQVERFFELLRRGVLTIGQPAVYPLSEVEQAHRDLESRRTTGSIILDPSQE